MSDMKLIMENWRLFEQDTEMADWSTSPEINESPVFLFEGTSRKHFKTMPFGKLFEILEEKKITLEDALHIWKKSTLYELDRASKKDKEVLKELFGKRGWEKEVSRQAKKHGESDPTAQKRGGLKYKALVIGSRLASQAIGKGFRFLMFVKKEMSQAAADISNLFNPRGWEKEAKAQASKYKEDDPTKIGQTLARAGALKIGKIISPVAKEFKKIIGTIFKLLKSAFSKFSAVMGNPYVKLGIIALCLVMASLSLWFPAFVVVVPFALRRIAFSTAGLALRKGVSAVASRAKQAATDAKAMAESMKKRLVEVIEGMEWVNDLKDISNIVGQAILDMAEEVGADSASFSIEDLAVHGTEGEAFSSFAVEYASVAEEQTLLSLDAIEQATLIAKKIEAAENSKEALKALKVLENAAPDDQVLQTVKKAIQMSAKLCEVDTNFCEGAAQLAQDIQVATDSDISSEITQWSSQIIKTVDGGIVDASSEGGMVSYSTSDNTSYLTGVPQSNQLPEA